MVVIAAGPLSQAEAKALLDSPDFIRLGLMLALERLSPLERAAFLLHDVFDFSFKEVAASGNEPVVYNYQDGGGGFSGVPSTIVAPALLFPELDLLRHQHRSSFLFALLAFGRRGCGRS